MDPLWFLLVARMLIAAGVVVGASLAVERTGPFAGAMIATLPLSAGPAYVFLAMDHGPAFLAESAVASLLAAAASAAFQVTYCAVAPHARTVPSLAAALGGWAVALTIFDRFSWSLGPAVLLVLASFSLAAIVTRAKRRVALPPIGRARPIELVGRAAAVMALVTAVTLAGRLLGPHAAGLFALMPVVFTSLIILVQPRAGGTVLAAVMAHGTLGMIGYGFALGLLAVTAIPLGSTVALLLAFAACVGWNGVLIAVRRRIAL